VNVRRSIATTTQAGDVRSVPPFDLELWLETVEARFPGISAGGADRVLPAVEVAEEGDDALVRVALPGVDADQDVGVEVDEGVVTIRLAGGASLRRVAPVDPGVAAAVPIELLGKLAAVTAASLSVMQEIAVAASRSQPAHVTLETPTGALEYTLPISLEETYSAADVSKVLSPTGKPHRSIAQQRRRSNQLLGIKIDRKQYRYPKFQIDEGRHEIRPVVAYANQRWQSSEDPWGTLDWWYTEEAAFDDRRPIDLLESGELTEELVDDAVQFAQQAMD
jgi:hypothetical protein